MLQKADKALYYVKHSGKGSYFFHEENEERKTQEDVLDLGKLASSLSAQGAYDGSLCLSFRDFTRMYDFIRHLGERYGYDMHLLVLSTEMGGQEKGHPEVKEEVMTFLEKSIQESLRSVDVCTRFGSEQFLVALLNAQDEDIANITERVFEKFYSVYDKEGIDLTYDFITMKG